LGLAMTPHSWTSLNRTDFVLPWMSSFRWCLLNHGNLAGGVSTLLRNCCVACNGGVAVLLQLNVQD
jgi:hypothetical protein